MSSIIEKGQEPERIKKRMDTLFPKLDEAYPDKVISGLDSDHKKWAETAVELSRALGYPSKKEFLEAYGYSVVRKEPSAPAGRPTTVDPVAIIQTLQERYPNGSGFTKVDDLFEANPDILPYKKTVSNKSSAVFGMPLGKYLLSIGLIKPKTELKPEKTVKEKKESYVVYEVAVLGVDLTHYYTFHSKSLHIGDYVEVPLGICRTPVFGKVTDYTICDEENAPCDLNNTESIFRKIGTRGYSKGMVRSVLNANVAMATDSVINHSSSEIFHESVSGFKESEGSILWADLRGLPSEIMKVLDYLVEKDNQIYEYTDIILAEDGVAELYVFADDVMDVLFEFPNVKAAMFAVNHQNRTVELRYSRSGYAAITDSYPIGPCDLHGESDWTVKHSPVDDFSEGELEYRFRYIDDWKKINYVYSDKTGERKRLIGEV